MTGNRIAIAFVALFLCGVPSAAQQSKRAAGQPATLSVHGEATVSVEPDIAELDVGLLSQGQTSHGAADQNTTKSKQFVAQLEQLVGQDNISSISLSVNPDYRYPKDGGAAAITGYTASNTFRLTIRDLSQLKNVIETATRAGAGSINRLTFDLKDEKAARARALAQAARQAQSGAEALASSLKMRMGRLIRIEEVQPVVISPAREIEAATLKEATLAQTTIAPGSIQIHASVNLVYAVYEK